MTYLTIDELMDKSREAKGLTFGDIDKYNQLTNTKNKGKLGHVIEKSFFGYDLNSSSKPDFENLKIELKVTPYKTNKDGTLSAKERLVLNVINYMKEIDVDFYNSSFWLKNEKLLLFFYEWIQDVKPSDYIVSEIILHEFSSVDLEVIKQDWKVITDKIKAGKAHELSEGDTMYLGACTKGANRNSVKPQPYSDLMAKQRAFSLKQSYMTSIVRKYVQGEELVDFASANELKDNTLENLLYKHFKPYIGLTDKEIAKKLDVELNASHKSSAAKLVSAMLGIKGTKLDNIAEFSKANIEFKTVRLEPNGMPQESMSFENINFFQWASEDWHNSHIKNRFEDTKFLFAVFEYKESNKNKNRKLYFKKVQLWSMPINTIDSSVQDFWKAVHSILNDRVTFEKTSRGTKNNFPGAKFNGIIHMRPKARNKNDKTKLPDGQMITKQCFWIDRKYIGKILK